MSRLRRWKSRDAESWPQNMQRDSEADWNLGSDFFAAYQTVRQILSLMDNAMTLKIGISAITGQKQQPNTEPNIYQ